MPKHKTRSTFKTDTHQGEGFNELRFEDEKGQEEIFVHAQKDRNSKVENNQSERVNVNKVESVGNNKASEVGANLLQVVDGDLNLRIGPGNTGMVTSSHADSDPEGMTGTPSGFSARQGDGNYTISVERNEVETIGANHDQEIAKNKQADVGSNYFISVGKKLDIRAGDSITLTCGQSKIVMEDNGQISVNGKTINVTADKLIKMLADVIKLN